ncbi:hypothetical protein RIF29_06928 [Crotalaria pallida]|uniref:Sugar phosphate transporter domain-containing protein n=1 Tax=Crotalaria pallida TaxID=3830 RepID=A0AAN9J3N9_CROPI
MQQQSLVSNLAYSFIKPVSPAFFPFSKTNSTNLLNVSSSFPQPPTYLSFSSPTRFQIIATSTPQTQSARDATSDSAAALSSTPFINNVNIHNKQVLKVDPFPVIVTAAAMGTAVMAYMEYLNLYKRPKICGGQLAAILQQYLGNLFTNTSHGKLSHTITAMEPLISTILSEGSNVNEVYVKQLLDALCSHAYKNGFNCGTFLRLRFRCGYPNCGKLRKIATAIAAAIQLRRLLHHSGGNRVKQVVDLVFMASSVLFGETPVSTVNAFSGIAYFSAGIAIALAFVFIYSRVKQIKPKTN